MICAAFYPLECCVWTAIDILPFSTDAIYRIPQRSESITDKFRRCGGGETDMSIACLN